MPYSIHKHLLFVLLIALAPHSLNAATQEEMIKRMEMLDKMDRMDLMEGLDKANACTRKRNFSCTEKELNQVRSLIKNSTDKKLYDLAQQNMTDEKAIIAEEIRYKKEQERLQREEEDRLERQRERELAAQRRQQEEENRARNLQFAMGAAALAATSKHMTQDQINRSMEALKNDYSSGSRNSQIFLQSLNQTKQENQQRHDQKMQEIREQQARQQREQDRLRRQAAEYAREQQQERDRQSRLAESRIQEQKDQAERKKAELEARAKQEAQERERQAQIKKEQAERERLAEQRRLEQQRENERREAEKIAQKEAAAKAKQDYFAQQKRDTRLWALKCFGDYYVNGSRPRVKPEVVACVDVYFDARCNSSNHTQTRGKISNFVGVGDGCYFGDTGKMEKLSCEAENIVVTVTDVRTCGE